MLLLACLSLASPAPQAAPLQLNQGQTRSIVLQYGTAKHWSLKGLLLLSLGGDWHPDGVEIVLDGLSSKDPHLRAYALEALLATDKDALPVVATVPLVELLIDKASKDRNDFYEARALELLGDIFPELQGPDGEAPDRRSVEKHWRDVKGTYQPAKWKAPGEHEHKSVALPLIERVLVLNEGGLQICLCIDTTGSMQTTIDASAEALEGIATLLSGMASSCEIGLVEYKDYTASANAMAQVAVAGRVSKLEDDVEKVFKKLSRLTAMGGGDIPERVEVGLELALDEDMGWERGANKLVIVIGDAPPHPEDEAKALEIVRAAHEKPFGAEPTLIAAKEKVAGRTSTRNSVIRPWVVSTICVGVGGRNPDTDRTFRAIAAAGGGAYATLILPRPDGKAVPGGMQSKDPSRDILRNVLVQSFGPQYERSLDQFISVFFEYDDAGYWDKKRR